MVETRTLFQVFFKQKSLVVLETAENSVSESKPLESFGPLGAPRPDHRPTVLEERSFSQEARVKPRRSSKMRSSDREGWFDKLSSSFALSLQTMNEAAADESFHMYKKLAFSGMAFVSRGSVVDPALCLKIAEESCEIASETGYGSVRVPFSRATSLVAFVFVVLMCACCNEPLANQPQSALTLSRRRSPSTSTQSKLCPSTITG